MTILNLMVHSLDLLKTFFIFINFPATLFFK